MKSIKHNAGDRNTLKVRALMQETGVTGLGVYWYLKEQIYEGELLEINEVFYNLYAVIFKIPPTEVEKVITALLKNDVFVMVGNLISLQDVQDIKEIRRNSGKKGMTTRWKDKEKAKPAEVVVEAKPEVIPAEAKKEEPKAEAPKEDRLGALIESAVANQKAKETKAPKKPAEKKVVATNPDEVEVSKNELDELEGLQPKKPLKDFEFLPLFNQIKKHFKPNSKGHQILTSTDKLNLRKLIKAGYGLEDFTRVIHHAMKNKWVQENDMDCPNHVLRNDNFERYLNKSEKETPVFTSNQTEQPIYK